MKPKNLLYLLFWSCVFFTPCSVLAQQKKFYQGPFQLNKYKGDAAYSYTLVGTDTIFDGSFRLQSANLDNLLKTGDSSFTISGSFTDNYPTDKWTFRFNEFQSDKSSSVEAYEYVLKVDGNQKFASGVLKKGAPHGQWVCAVYQIKNSQISTTDFESTISFKNGIPQQDFTIQSEEKELVGRFLRNGLAHDEWTLYADHALDAVEIWRFNEGILENIQFKDTQNTLTTEIYDRDFATTKIIPLDHKYLDILKIKLPEKTHTQLAQSSIIRLLQQNAAFYQDIQTLLSDLSTASFSPDFKVKVPYSPLNSSEKKQLDAITTAYEQSRNISDILLENTELNILKIADQKVRTLEESVALVTTAVLDPLESLTRFYKNETLSLISRREFLSKVWAQKKTSIVPGIAGAAIEKAKNKTLANTKLLADETLHYLDSIQQILTKNIAKQKREQEAVLLEKKLISHVAYLERLQDSLLIDSIPAVFAETIGNIKKDTAEKLQVYSSMQNAKAKLNYARELVYCFENLDQVGEAIAHLPEQQYTIQNRYQDAIWNPFTATIMNEFIKKRLVMAYNTVLIPHFLKEIEEGLACEDTAQWIALLEATYDRMLELRNEDTKKLERKLKKEKDPLVVLQRLKIKPQISTNK